MSTMHDSTVGDERALESENGGVECLEANGSGQAQQHTTQLECTRDAASSPPAVPSRTRRRTILNQEALRLGSNRKSMILPKVSHFEELGVDTGNDATSRSSPLTASSDSGDSVATANATEVSHANDASAALARRRHTVAFHLARIRSIENDTLMLVSQENTPTFLLDRFDEIQRIEDLPVQFFKKKKPVQNEKSAAQDKTNVNNEQGGNGTGTIGELGTSLETDGTRRSHDSNNQLITSTNNSHPHLQHIHLDESSDSLAAHRRTSSDRSEHSYLSDSESSLSSSELQKMESFLPPDANGDSAESDPGATTDTQDHPHIKEPLASTPENDKYAQFLQLQEEIAQMKQHVHQKRKEVAQFMQNLQHIETQELERKRQREERILMERLRTEVNVLKKVLHQKENHQRNSKEHLEQEQQKVAHKLAHIQEQRQEMDTLRMETQKLAQMLNLERQKKCHDLFHYIYPIQSKEQTGGLRKILGMTIYRGESLLAGNDTSTALGCVAHCMSLLSEIYSIPLLYAVRFVSSRSMIYDSAPQAQLQPPSSRWLPLFAASAKEKPRLLRAVHLLLCNVRHFMACVGMDVASGTVSVGPGGETVDLSHDILENLYLLQVHLLNVNPNKAM